VPDWNAELIDAAAEAADARTRLLNTITAAHNDGVTVRAIAAAVGLSHQRIHQIIHGR